MKRLTDQIRRVGLVANPDKKSGAAAVRKAAALIRASGREVLADAATVQISGSGHALTEVETESQLAEQVDLLLVLGGDGTMLRVARNTSSSGTPIFGVNLGTLGFLTACRLSQLARALTSLWSGQCVVEPRWLIESTTGAGRRRERELALNDFVVIRGTVPRLIELEVRVDGDLLTSYRGDGLIVSSPTGSTAYSLAAGGAVVSPRAEVFALTPICAHTLSSRSVIVNLDSVVEVRLISQRVEAFLAADGQTPRSVQPGEVLRFRRARAVARLVRLPDSSFFDTLRQKLNWSGSSV
ncbi:MAG: NAD(+)/NADH kinase [Limisphaerales bacterium]